MTPRPTGAEREFPGPILGGDVTVPSSRQLRRARKPRRRPLERILRIAVVVVAALVLLVGLGYGYFRYEWGKVSSSPCSTCVAGPNGQPYNVLVIGSDSRVGETPAEALHFGSAPAASAASGATPSRSSAIDPSAGTASSLSIPRDTYVTLSGMPASSQLSSAEQDQRRVRRRSRRPDQDHPEHLRHPDQPLHRDQLLRTAGRGERPRGNLDGLPLPGPRPGLLDRRLQQQLRPQRLHDRLPGARTGRRRSPCPGRRYFEYDERRRGGSPTRPATSAGSSART